MTFAAKPTQYLPLHLESHSVTCHQTRAIPDFLISQGSVAKMNQYEKWLVFRSNNTLQYKLGLYRICCVQMRPEPVFHRLFSVNKTNCDDLRREFTCKILNWHYLCTFLTSGNSIRLRLNFARSQIWKKRRILASAGLQCNRSINDDIFGILTATVLSLLLVWTLNDYMCMVHQSCSPVTRSAVQ